MTIWFKPADHEARRIAGIINGSKNARIDFERALTVWCERICIEGESAWGYVLVITLPIGGGRFGYYEEAWTIKQARSKHGRHYDVFRGERAAEEAKTALYKWAARIEKELKRERAENCAH